MVVFYLRGRTERVDGAGVAELADARDSKSRFLLGSVGSTPSSGTTYRPLGRRFGATRAPAVPTTPTFVRVLLL